MSREIPIFIGFDPDEAIAYHVCCQSILDQTKHPVCFYPITGERRDGSNRFIYERFTIPWRMGFHGHALWLDGDMIVRGDIAELWEQRQSGYCGVQVVKHDYRTKHPVKYLGNKNEDYPRKNWSSVILWNCDYMPHRCLTPEFVSRASGSYLHRFEWLPEASIIALPEVWNKLVLEQELSPEDRIRHYTIGIPAFREYEQCEGSQEWWDVFNRATEPARNVEVY